MLCPNCGTENPGGSTSCSACASALGPNPVAGAVVPYSPSLPEGVPLARGHYTVGKILGQGGFGITYKGGDMQLRRFVAIKEFFPFGCSRQDATVQPTGGMSQADYASIKAKFLEEARTLARFNHPGIVRVFAIFEENNTAYMVMEFLEGRTLQQILEDRGAIAEREAIAYVEKVGEALESVHAASLIHRDIKPDNIMLTDEGRVVLIDFGTARQFASQRTVKQTAMITPGYAPLEQYGSSARFGIYSDIYALGATLYHCLTGQLPPQATDRATGVELPEAASLNPQISLSVSRALTWALQLRAADRPQTVREFLAALQGVAPPTMLGQAPSGQASVVWVQRTSEAQLLTNASPERIVEALQQAFARSGVRGLSLGADRMSISGAAGTSSDWQELVGQLTPGAQNSVVSVGSRAAGQWSEPGSLRPQIQSIMADVEQALRLGQPSSPSFSSWQLPQQPPFVRRESGPPLPFAFTPGQAGPGLMHNTSGHPGAALPPELNRFKNRFNWGACLLNWVWALANGQAALGLILLLLCWVPFLPFISAIVLGVKGNEMAWSGRRWESTEHFESTQRVWTIWGVSLVALGFLFMLLAVLLGS